MKKHIIAAAGLLGSTVPIHAQELIDKERLISIASVVREFQPNDKFEEPPIPPTVSGLRFSVVIEPIGTSPNTSSCAGYPSWQYRAADREFSVSGWPASLGGRPKGLNSVVPREKWHKIKHFGITCTAMRLPDYTAENGFGAEFLIKAKRETLTGIAFPYKFDRKWKPYWIGKLPAEKARALSQNVRVRITGTLGDWPTGQSVFCSDMRLGPSARFTFDIQRETCLFKGDVELFEIFDISTGEVLHTSVPAGFRRKK